MFVGRNFKGQFDCLLLIRRQIAALQNEMKTGGNTSHFVTCGLQLSSCRESRFYSCTTIYFSDRSLTLRETPS